MPTAPAKQPKPRPPTHKEAISVALGKRLKELRIAADRSQSELAFDCELDRTYISLIERGLANPSLWTLGTLAFALKTTVPDLLHGNAHVVKPSMGAQGRKRRVNQASHEARHPVGSRRSQLR
ncbi:helix-turn-helix domain-containing protein [Variovorax sp. DT-64]|uniref:helix-turn-helix domain-containing protein n=1 Tax=Variovorax sp. DT-64 TaxID=3396160 RepID=UPI003F1DC656